MIARGARLGAIAGLATACALTAVPDRGASASSAEKPPAAYLIYLIDGRDPIIVKRYVEEHDQIRFEKYGGWVGIPKYEVLRIVPDNPDTTANLPAVTLAAPTASKPDPRPAAAGDGELLVSMRGGEVKATGVTADGERLRVTVADGSFTIPRADLVGVVRLPAAVGVPEAWLTLYAGETAEHNGAARGSRKDAPLGHETSRPSEALSLPYPSSGRPHLVRLANGESFRIDGFWVEDGEVRFRRFGGLVGVALAEIVRLIPEEVWPAHGRTPARFVQQLGADLIEVRVQGALQRVRLIGVAPLAGAQTVGAPWRQLKPGLVVYLEFDRRRYDARGDWLAYTYLPNGRMLNGELIRLGLARPLADGQNIRYLDLFEELRAGQAASPGSARTPP